MDILRKLKKAFTRENATDADATVMELRRVLRNCPACGGSLAGHYYSIFAITIDSIENKARLVEFFKALQEHRWKDARDFQEFDPLLDAVVAFALRCVSGTITVLMVRDPYELMESDSLLEYEVIESAEELSELIDESKWELVQE